MPSLPPRLHVRHTEIPCGICHVTWRLHRDQPLLTPPEREIVLGVLKRAPEFGAIWYAAVVMDDHVHALFAPGDQRPSGRFVQSWKGASSRLVCVASHHPSPLWQTEYYQRWIAFGGLLDRCAAYIRRNPFRRWPGLTSYPWLLP